jgi:PQQ-like domain
VLSLLGERGLYVGLDAVTGAKLWTSTDPTIGAALDVGDSDYASPHFVVRDDGRWTALDPHTGRRTWSIVDPVHCPGGVVPDGMLPTAHGQHVYPVDTPTRIGAVLDCSTRDRVDLRLITVNPSSGAVTADKTLSALEGLPRGDIQSWAAVAVPGADAVILKLFSTTRPLDAYVDATGLRTDFPGPNPLAPIGDGMFTMRDGPALRIYSGEALVQCDIPLGGAADYAFLRDQVAVLDEQPHQLRVFDRKGCQQVGTVAVPAGFEDITPARGVTLLTHHTGRRVVRTSLLGFAPEAR